MIKKLRRRLTLHYAALSGLVLLATCVSGFLLSARQQRAADELLFQTHLSDLTGRLQFDRRISGDWLARFEAENRLAVFLWDAGQPMKFEGAAWLPTDRRGALARAARESAFAAGFRPEDRPLRYAAAPAALEEDDLRFRGVAAAFPLEDGGWLHLLLLRDLAPQRAALKMLALRWTALFFAAGAALTLAGRWLSGRAAAPVRDSLRRQAEFVAAASHELRGPLAVITSSADLMAEGMQGPYLANICGEARRMAGLVEDLLTLAGAEAAAAPPAVPVEPDTLLIEAYDRFAPVCAQRGLRLCAALPPSPLPPVAGDPERLMQILSALLSNACAYTPPGGTISLSGRVQRGRVLLQVADTGPGVPGALREKIFERFYRAEPSRTDKAHYGLGLPVARQLAALYGGRLTAGEAEDGGALFTLSLPVPTCRTAPRRDEKHRAAGPGPGSGQPRSAR
ncbi:HAMP domain-containing histidine kinase [Anaerofilum sp. BX8]|uniref:histidine kinase n=1 Tax=Anaerofilum hominis TaxID=2763016 RepID=A0A923I4D8_9FIRM|nr:HAMP domain-containing sensor histidine kinase [Anaerofilum hominis]MBC5580120.1 HAMP domain-containing histidine kinase [Anaerofilum hominis]